MTEFLGNRNKKNAVELKTMEGYLGNPLKNIIVFALAGNKTISGYKIAAFITYLNKIYFHVIYIITFNLLINMELLFRYFKILPLNKHYANLLIYFKI